MKRLGSSDSLSALMSICPTSADHEQNQGNVYPREFQSMLEGLDEEGCVEETGHVPEKKRRLSVDQVKALEKNFEVENKLEPERKVKLAQELGLQPRQVAVWFQNRRARWKTKQLERDYGVLKANYDALKHNYEALQHDNEALVKEIRELKAKLQEDKAESKVSVKEEGTMMVSESEEDKLAIKADPVLDEMIPECDENDEEEDYDDDPTKLNFQTFNNNGGLLMGSSIFTDFKDGSSDSDSSAILNEDNINTSSPNSGSGDGGGAITGHVLHESPHQFFTCSSLSSSSSINGFQFSTSESSKAAAILGGEEAQKVYQPQFVKIEEHNFFSGDESCSTFFTDDQPPSLHWDCPEDWNC